MSRGRSYQRGSLAFSTTKRIKPLRGVRSSHQVAHTEVSSPNLQHYVYAGEDGQGRFRGLSFRFRIGTAVLHGKEKISIGTSGWSYPDWVGPFYPEGAVARDFLSAYTQKFSVVEVDSTFYALPSATTVENWARRTPEEFRFALKVPGTVTHGQRGERPNVSQVLRDPAGELERFLELLQLLGERLAVVLFQFPYFRVKEFAVGEFLSRLASTLSTLPQGKRFAVEVRNKSWIGPELLGLLREHRVALAFLDHPYMPLPKAQAMPGRLTADFAYVRLLGDRYAIEKRTKKWGEPVLDRESRLREWAEILVELAANSSISNVFAFANNHFSGHGPATCRQLSAFLHDG